MGLLALLMATASSGASDGGTQAPISVLHRAISKR
jgi:hypothetical protein